MRKHLLFISFLVLVFASCENKSTTPSDTQTSGTIDISVDETYKPIIEEQLRIFDSSYPNAHIHAHYKPEAECFKDFFDNKARLILVTRPLTADEKTLCEQRKIVPTAMDVAKDAIAVVINPSAPDTEVSLSTLRGILSGVYPKKYIVVFDNEGSSTVRYVTDSLLKNEKLGANVYAAKGNPEVVDYVAKNPTALGFIGISYVSDPTDTLGQGFMKKINVAAIYNDTLHAFYLPSQRTIGLNEYALTRKLYFINSDTWVGLGTGFVNYLCSYRGQLVFKHAMLLPTRVSITFQETTINPNSPANQNQ